MARFVKTRLSVVSAVLLLLALYALGGFVHAVWTGAGDAATTWAIVAVGAVAGSAGYQWLAARRRRSA